MAREIFRQSPNFNFDEFEETDASSPGPSQPMSAEGRSWKRSILSGDEDVASESEVEVKQSVRPKSKESSGPYLQRGASGLSYASTPGSSGADEPLEVPFILTERAKLAIGIAVLLNAAAMTVEVEAELQLGRSSVLGLTMYGFQIFFLLVFIVELFLNIRCHGLSFFYRRGGHVTFNSVSEVVNEVGYKIQFQGVFDFFVVLAALVDLCIMRPMDFMANSRAAANSSAAFSAFRVLQLFRLARIFQLLRLSHELSSLAFNLAMSLKAVFWVFLLLFTLIYIGALFCASELGHDQKLKGVFGNIWISIFSHFKLMTLEQWVDICNLAMEVNPVWAVYFLFFIILTNLTLVNLVTGLIITGVVEHAREDNWTWQQRLVEEAPFMKAIHDFVEQKLPEIWKDDSTLTAEGFEVLLSDLQFQHVLAVYGISIKLEPSKLYEIISTEAQGHLDVQALARGLLQMRGSYKSLHPVFVRHDLNVATRAFKQRVKELSVKVPETYAAGINQCEQDIVEKLSTFDAHLRGLQRHKRASIRRSRHCPDGTPEPGISNETMLAERLLPSLHSACESVETLRGKIAAAEAAELRDLQKEEHQLESYLRRPGHACSRGTQTSHRTKHAARSAAFHPPQRGQEVK